MRNYVRALRLTLRYRFTFAAAIFCSLMVAVLWGGNIGAVYPFVEVVFQGRSLQDWAASEIAEGQSRLADYQQQIGQLRRDRPQEAGPEQTEVDRQISYLDSKAYSEEKGLALTQWLQPYINRYLPTSSFLTLVFIVAALLAGTFFKDAFLLAHGLLVERLSLLAAFDLRKQYFRQALDMDLSAFGEERTGQLLSRLTNDVGALQLGIQVLLGKAFREPLKAIVCLILAALICWRLLLFSLIICPLAMWGLRVLAGSIKRASRRALEDMGQLFNLISETFVSIKVVKAFTMEPYERKRFHDRAKHLYHKSMKIAVYNSFTKPLTEVMGMGVICLAILAGAYLVLNQKTDLFGIPMSETPLSLNALTLFFGLLVGASDPIRKLSDVFSLIHTGAAAADRVYEVLDRQPSIVDPPQPKTLPQPHRRLVLDHVHFHYLASQPVLRDVSLEVPFGQSLAIVGPNGCGKSTLMNLIPRFLDPCQGAVRIGDVDLRELRMRNLRQRIGLVTQETMLFDDTIMNNIRYGSTDATDEQVIEAAKKAHAHRFILDRLDNGYETIVGQSGGRLSGGQRQRISLARAILRDPEILLLDEATSQIDLESEQLIHQVLQEFIRGRTTIMITHRMSTLALADRILVMDGGRILDIGSHAELMERCDLYRRLHEIQLKKSA